MYKTKWALKKQRHKIAKVFILSFVKLLFWGEVKQTCILRRKKRLNTPPQGSAKCSARISYQHQKNHQTNPLFHPFSGVKVRMWKPCWIRVAASTSHAPSDTCITNLLRTILLVKKSSSELSDIDPSSALISWPTKRERNETLKWMNHSIAFIVAARRAWNEVIWCTFHWCNSTLNIIYSGKFNIALCKWKKKSHMQRL